MFSDTRLKVHKRDIVALLQDAEFLDANKGAHNLVFADIPYGFFKLRSDILWDETTIRSVCVGVLAVLVESGTFVVRLSGLYHDLWRSCLEQAGFSVDRDAHLLLQRAAWMKQKTYYQYGASCNPTHFWLLARKNRNEFFEANKPFGQFLSLSLSLSPLSYSTLTLLF